MKYQIILLASAALVSAAALADDREDKDTRGASSTFEMLDKDSDGKLSEEEVAGNDKLSGSFDRLDSNDDGFVSKREFRRNTMKRDTSTTF
jgi:Ca2+-binding EF-hand superfamily protein